MKQEWIDALSRITCGLYVLTTSYKEGINGMIASWVSQVSYEPPLVMIAVHPNRYSHYLVEQSGYFALNVLTKDQSHLVPRFKGPDPATKFSSIAWRKGLTDCPIITDCAASLEFKVATTYRPGNHTLFIGELIDASVLLKTEPLTTRDYDRVYLGKA